MSGSLGFNKSKSRSGSQQQTFVDPSQQPFLDLARGQATELQSRQQGQIGGLFDLAGSLGQQGQGFLGGIEQSQRQLQQGFAGGFGQGQAGIDALTAQSQGQGLGQGQLRQIASGNDPAVQQQIDLLGGDIARQFEQLLPGIESQAIGGGQLGGGRQGVAQGLGLQASQDAFARGAGDIRFQDLNRQFGAAGALSQGQQAAGGALGQLGGQQELGAAGLNQAGELGAGQLGLGGLQSLQGQFNLGFSPFEAEFTPLQNLAQIIGGPTILGSGSSFGKTDQFGFDASGGVLQF